MEDSSTHVVAKTDEGTRKAVALTPEEENQALRATLSQRTEALEKVSAENARLHATNSAREAEIKDLKNELIEMKVFKLEGRNLHCIT